MSAYGSIAATQSNPQHTSLSACQGPSVGNVAKVIPLGKVLHRVSLWCQWRVAWRGLHDDPGRAYKKPPRNPRADNLLELMCKGAQPGARNSRYTHEPDVLDAGDAVEGLRVGSLPPVRISNWPYTGNYTASRIDCVLLEFLPNGDLIYLAHRSKGNGFDECDRLGNFEAGEVVFTMSGDLGFA